MLDGACRGDAAQQTSSGHPTPDVVNPCKPRDGARDGRSGEREDVLQDGAEVLIEGVGESLFANPRTPLVSYFVLVGDTGIEPVTSSVSGINTVLSTPPLSTKTVRGRPPMSTQMRGRCQAISQSAPSPWARARTCQC